MRKFFLGLVVLLAACTTSGASWTALDAANVEYAAGTAIELQLVYLEGQMPSQKAAIQVAGQAFAKALTVQINDMLQGSSAAVQTKDAAINAVIAALPNLNVILQAAMSRPTPPSSAQLLSGAITFLANEASFVGPAVIKANAAATTTADVQASALAFGNTVGTL